mmetsp:Transcript_10011/g.12367  ORF Transcript_10011/g.12367 Transcript_10011/m.12367 type:complete len:218 (-) Transcript_10011:18-671(-)
MSTSSQDVAIRCTKRNKRNEERWIKHFEELKSFKARTGHCRVSLGSNDNKSLAVWVHTQRTQYRLMTEKKKSRLTPSRAQALSNIGFEWGKNSNEVWQKHYTELKSFKARTGHCRVPQRFVENQTLATWVKNQHFHYKLMAENKPTSMTVKRAKALEDIGMIRNSKKQKTTYPSYDRVLWKGRTFSAVWRCNICLSARFFSLKEAQNHEETCSKNTK